jgi:cytochrome P450
MSEAQHTINEAPHEAGASRCPVFSGFDPLDDLQTANPHEWAAKARRDQPVFYMPQYDMWCVTRYEDIHAMFSDPITYSNAGSHNVDSTMPEEIRAEVGPDYSFPVADHLNSLDPPDHTRIRKLVQPAFTPSRVAEFKERIVEIVDESIDAVEDRGEMDVASEFAGPLPPQVMAVILGIDRRAPEVAKFREWVDSFFKLDAMPNMEHDAAAHHWRHLLELDRFIRGFLERNRRNPVDCLTTDWMNARTDDGSPSLSDTELLAAIVGVQAAGSDTTGNWIAQTVYDLLRFDMWEVILADPSLIPRALEESLRLLGPVRGLIKFTTREVKLSGVKVPAGATLYLSLPSANLDEDQFENPADYDIYRRNVKEHLGFGLRTHFCVGAPLARLEGRIALERLASRLPRLRLKDPEAQIRYSSSLMVPGVHDIHVEWA